MKITLSLYYIFSCLLISAVSFAQAPFIKQWDSRFGGGGPDLFQDFIITSSGEYLLTGYIGADSSGDITEPARGATDFWIVKTNAQGLKQWDKRFGGGSDDPAYTAQQTNDGGFIIGGWSASNAGGDKTTALKGVYDYWIIKIDSLGNKQWEKDFGGNNGNVFVDVQQTADGGYIIGGHTNSDSSGDKTQPNWGLPGMYNDWWIVKTDTVGNKQWDKRFGSVQNDIFTSLNQTPDGGYILGGYTDGAGGDKTQPSQGGADYWIVKTDAAGNKQWDKRYGGADTDELYKVVLTPDGGYLLGGASGSAVGGDKTQPTWGYFDYWVIKTDSLGVLQWDKDYGSTSTEELLDMAADGNGNYLISGDSYSPIGGNKTENNLGIEQSWIIKIDATGNILWDKTIKTTGHDETTRIVDSGNGCFTMANFTNSGMGGFQSNTPRGAEDYWMLKFCDSTSTTSLSPLTSPHLMPEVFIAPNPTRGAAVLNNVFSDGDQVKINDRYGRVLFTKTITTQTLNITLQTADYIPGIYFVEIINGNQKRVCKLIKL